MKDNVWSTHVILWVRVNGYEWPESESRILSDQRHLTL
jgi:hypothetical protein